MINIIIYNIGIAAIYWIWVGWVKGEIRWSLKHDFVKSLPGKIFRGK